MAVKTTLLSNSLIVLQHPMKTASCEAVLGPDDSGTRPFFSYAILPHDDLLHCGPLCPTLGQSFPLHADHLWWNVFSNPALVGEISPYSFKESALPEPEGRGLYRQESLPHPLICQNRAALIGQSCAAPFGWGYSLSLTGWNRTPGTPL